MAIDHTGGSPYGGCAPGLPVSVQSAQGGVASVVVSPSRVLSAPSRANSTLITSNSAFGEYSRSIARDRRLPPPGRFPRAVKSALAGRKWVSAASSSQLMDPETFPLPKKSFRISLTRVQVGVKSCRAQSWWSLRIANGHLFLSGSRVSASRIH